jgi:hypothetical protein
MNLRGFFLCILSAYNLPTKPGFTNSGICWYFLKCVFSPHF